MMKQFYLLAGIVALAAVPMAAQTTVRSIDSISLRTDNPQDPLLPRRLSFGYATDYTDSVDDQQGKGEFFLPFLGPPSDFYAILEGRGYQNEVAFGYRDVRGLPDSVGAGKVDTFSLVYTIRLQQGLGTPIISTSRPLASGMDSIHIFSTQPGANFSHTFSHQGGEVTLNHKEIATLRMVVYYSYERTLSVPVAADRPKSFDISPNPLRAGGRIDLRGEIPSGSRVMVSDVRGVLAHEERIEEGGAGVQLVLPMLPSGVYMVRVVGRGGDVVGEGRFVNLP